jgi:hypothetical protein
MSGAIPLPPSGPFGACYRVPLPFYVSLMEELLPLFQESENYLESIDSIIKSITTIIVSHFKIYSMLEGVHFAAILTACLIKFIAVARTGRSSLLFLV